MAPTLSLNAASLAKANVSLRSSKAVRGGVALPQRKAMKVCNRQSVKTQALSEANIVISGATAGMLFIGRYAFLPFQRSKVDDAGLPTQNGVTHEEAGDIFAKEATFIMQTKDPAGFNLVDVMAWGSLGHAVGYAILACSP